MQGGNPTAPVVPLVPPVVVPVLPLVVPVLIPELVLETPVAAAVALPDEACPPLLPVV